LRNRRPFIAVNGCGQADVAGFKVRKFHFSCMLIRIPDDRGEHSARNSACPLLATVGKFRQTAEERFWPLSPAGRGICPAFSSKNRMMILNINPGHNTAG